MKIATTAFYQIIINRADNSANKNVDNNVDNSSVLAGAALLRARKRRFNLIGIMAKNKAGVNLFKN